MLPCGVSLARRLRRRINNQANAFAKTEKPLSVTGQLQLLAMPPPAAGHVMPTSIVVVVAASLLRRPSRGGSSLMARAYQLTNFRAFRPKSLTFD